MTNTNVVSPLQLELNRIAGQRYQLVNYLNMGRIKTWMDVYRLLGHTRDEMEYAQVANLDAKPTRLETLQLIETLKQKAQLNEIGRKWIEAHPEISLPSLLPNDTGHQGGLEDNAVDTPRKEILAKTDTSLQESNLLSWTSPDQHPKQTARLWDKQEEAAKKAYDGIIKGKRAQLLQAGTGAGKTYVVAGILRQLIDNGWLAHQQSISPWPIVYITKSSILEQTERVLRDEFGLDVVNEVKVINIEQLRANFGSMFIEWKTLVESGVEHECPVWKYGVHPIFFVWDECHILKNVQTQQSQIAQDVNNLERRYYADSSASHHIEVYQLFASATPFTRVCEAQCFAVATHCDIADYNTQGGTIALTNANWGGFAKTIASPADPDEHSPGAIDRLVQYLLPYIVDIKGLRPQFHPNNRVEIIPFETPVEAKQYQDAWDEYLKQKSELENDDMLSGGQIGMMVLASFTIFRKKAEWIRAPGTTKRMMEAHEKGFAPIGAFCFKAAIVRAVLDLIEVHKIPRNRISLIWGGASAKAVKPKIKKLKQTLKDKMSPDEVKNFITSMTEAGMDAGEIQELLDDTVGWTEQAVEQTGIGYNYDKTKLNKYKLGPQSKSARQEEIDRFQSGFAQFCFFTFKAGGVGLSLHHTDTLTKQKVRKHDNGNWAKVEDISLIPVRPRKTFVTPTFSAIELVQGLGRAPRLTSLSDTEQILLFYKGTIEEKVAYIVSTKLKCLKKVVRQKESWEPMILTKDGDEDTYVAQYAPKALNEQSTNDNNKQEEDEDDVFLSESGDDED